MQNLYSYISFIELSPFLPSSPFDTLLQFWAEKFSSFIHFSDKFFLVCFFWCFEKVFEIDFRYIEEFKYIYNSLYLEDFGENTNVPLETFLEG